jgi:hypothetical protein
MRGISSTENAVMRRSCKRRTSGKCVCACMNPTAMAPAARASASSSVGGWTLSSARAAASTSAAEP